MSIFRPLEYPCQFGAPGAKAIGTAVRTREKHGPFGPCFLFLFSFGHDSYKLSGCWDPGVWHNLWSAVLPLLLLCDCLFPHIGRWFPFPLRLGVEPAAGSGAFLRKYRAVRQSRTDSYQSQSPVAKLCPLDSPLSFLAAFHGCGYSLSLLYIGIGPFAFPSQRLRIP